MGRDITCLTKHNFSFQNMDELIQILSKRFNANVYYIFGSYINFDPYFERIDKSDLIHNIEVNGYIIKKHIVSPDLPNLSIEEENYMYKFLLKKYGEDAGNLNDFKKHWSDNTIDNNSIIKGFANDDSPFTICFDDFTLWISNEVAEINHNNYFGRWWDMYRTLLQDDQFDLMGRFLEYRKRNCEIALKIGGQNIYYIDDQSSNTGIGQGNEWNLTWSEIEAEFNSGNIGQNQINLVLLLTDKEYAIKIRTEVSKDRNHEKHSVFYDDFTDLTNIN